MSKLDQLLQACLEAVEQGDGELLADRIEALQASYPHAAQVIIEGLAAYLYGIKPRV